MYFFLVRGCAQALIPLFIAPDKNLRLIISRLHGLFNNSQCVSIRVVKKSDGLVLARLVPTVFLAFLSLFV